MVKEKDKILDQFSQLPNTVKNELNDLHKIQNNLIEEKLHLIEKYVPKMIDRLLKDYHKICQKEVNLEQKISSFGSKHGFTAKQLRDIRVMLIEEKYENYLKKKGL